MFFDPVYMMVILAGLVLSGLTSAAVRIAFNRGKHVELLSGITGAEAAERIIRSTGLEGVTITRSHGILSDHYNPMTRTLALSAAVYEGRNAAAAGVAAHEAGHAIQHARGYFPLWFRSALVPVARIGSSLGIWLIIGGMILQGLFVRSGNASGAALEPGSTAWMVAMSGIVLFGAAVLFSIVTVPVEFNASRRAKALLTETGIVQTDEERAAVSSVLTAAGLTYVAAAITAVLQLLYWLYRLGFFRRR